MKRGYKNATRACTRNHNILVSCKRSQILGMPFQVIFSIILIIAFIGTAIYAISIWWSPSKCAVSDQEQEASLKQNLQEAVDGAFSASRTSRDFTANLPGKIEYVCFLDYNLGEKGEFSSYYDKLMPSSNYNLYLYPIQKACDGFKKIKINHINVTKITEKDNPYCIKNTGEITLIIEKGYYESLVSIN